MFLVAPPFFRASSAGLPERTLVSIDLYGGAVFGYVRPGSATSTSLGVSGGALSGTMVDGLMTDAIVYGLGDGVAVVLEGNASTSVAAITGLMVNSTFRALIKSEYSPEVGTSLEFEGSIVAATYTVQLV